jgi:hypothetical protein
MASWKEGFLVDIEQNMHPASKEEEHEKWKENFFELIKDNPQHVNQPFSVLKFHLCVDREQGTRDQPMPPVSNIASMVAKYAVDNIIEDTYCLLHVSLRRKEKTIKVAEGIAMVGRTFHNAPIASNSAKVQVLRVVDNQYLDTKLYYPNEDEAIEKLQDAMNNFIL